MKFSRFAVCAVALVWSFVIKAGCLSAIQSGMSASTTYFKPDSYEMAGNALASLHSVSRLKFVVGQLEKQMQDVAAHVKSGDLYTAYKLLNDDHVFEEIPIRTLPINQRKVLVFSPSDLKLDPKAALARPEHRGSSLCYFRCDIIEGNFNGSISTREVYIDAYKWGWFGKKRLSLWDRSLDKDKRVRRFREEEIRALLEEKAHSLQLLKRAAYGSPYLALEGPLLSRVLKMHQDINSHPHVNGTERENGFDIEADVYAYMIKILGKENVPILFGIISGYPTRSLVDAVHGREWPQEIHQTYNQEFGHDVFSGSF